MSRQGGFKQGLASNGQKEDSARDLLADDKPRGNPVGGAFGSKDDVVESNHLEPNAAEDDRREKTYE
jgi:hypothetical protein